MRSFARVNIKLDAIWGSEQGKGRVHTAKSGHIPIKLIRRLMDPRVFEETRKRAHVYAIRIRM